jgi:hypothetical protein
MSQTEGLTNLRNITDAIINEIDKTEEVEAPKDYLPERFKAQSKGVLPLYLQKARTVMNEYTKKLEVMIYAREIGGLKNDVKSRQEQEETRYRAQIVTALFWLAVQEQYGYDGGGYIIGNDWQVAQMTYEQAKRIGQGLDTLEGPVQGSNVKDKKVLLVN